MSVNLYDKTNNELKLIAGGLLYADNPVGSIVPYGGTTAPNGWLICQGQAVSRTTYAELFAVIGTAFGSGDGSTTFNIPDLRESTTKGVGLSGNSENHYSENGVTLGEFIEDRIQSHTHGVQNGYDGSNEGSAERGDARHGYSIRTNNATGRTGNTTEVKAVGVNYIIKAKHTPVPIDFMNAVDEAMNECKILPYEFNHSSNITAFNRKFLYEGNPITWTATHTGRLTIRLIKHGDGYSLYLQNQNNVMLDSYDNFLGTNDHGTAVTDTSITLQAWVRKGDIITLTSNLPASTDWDDTFFVQTGLLAYNDNFD